MKTGDSINGTSTAARSGSLPILLAEDGAVDLWRFRQAFEQAGLPGGPIVVRNGVETIDYLGGRGIYQDRKRYPFPYLLILDLKMSRKNSRDVLEWWKAHRPGKPLNIIVLTSSPSSERIEQADRLGGVFYMRKPVKISDTTEVVRRILEFWSLVERPDGQAPGPAAMAPPCNEAIAPILA